MPRNASKIFYNLPGTEGFPDTTIESPKYNNFIADIAFDLNLPRPIVAGGTGADDADEALINLSAEKASQFVSDFNTHVWLPGSFRSGGSATAGPVSGHAFTGTVHINDFLTNPPLNENVVVTARDMDDTVTPKRIYVREKKAGTWLNSGAWTVIDATTLPFTPGGSISATTIQAAIQELDTEKASLVYVDNRDTALTAYVDSNINDTLVFLDSEITDVQADRITGDANLQTQINTLAATSATSDAMAYAGLQINGAMEVTQERGFIGTATNNSYACDGWKLLTVGTMAVGAGAGQSPQIANGIPNYLAMNVGAAQTTLGAGDHAALMQPLEGWRIQRLDWGRSTAQPITIAFWSNHTRAGLYSVAIRNVTAALRSYVTTYTQVTGSVPQYNVMTVPGDTAPEWFDVGSAGAEFTLTFAVACGTTYTAPSINTWLAGNYFAAPGQINGVSIATSDMFRASGVFIIPGTTAPLAAQSARVMRPYIDELQLCKRYYQKYSNFTVDTSGAAHTFVFPVAMRVAPTISGGGAGFLILGATNESANLSQTTRGSHTIVLDARM